LRIGACLSLSGKFAQFGSQAAQRLEAWRSLNGNADILVEDDHSDRRTLEAVLPGVAATAHAGRGRRLAADLGQNTHE
jgi:hypothetical protein